MSSQETLLQIVNDSPLSEATKGFFAKKIAREGATQENITAVKEFLRAAKQQVAAEMGTEVDANDPSIQEAQEKMQTEIREAADSYAKTMKRLEEEANRLASDIQEDLKNLEKIVVDSAQSEA